MLPKAVRGSGAVTSGRQVSGLTSSHCPHRRVRLGMPPPTSRARPGEPETCLPWEGPGLLTLSSEKSTAAKQEPGGGAPETQRRAHRGLFGERPVLACGSSWLLDIQPSVLLPTAFFRDLPSSSGQETAQPHHSLALLGSPDDRHSSTGMRIRLGQPCGVGQRTENIVSSVGSPGRAKDASLLRSWSLCQGASCIFSST